jgi:hypothetical protein
MSATLLAASVEIKDMLSYARNTAVIEQSFADVKDSQYENCLTAGDINYCCGPRKYELEKAGDYKSFFTIDFENRPIKMSLLSLNDSDIGSYDMNLIVSLKNWHLVKPVKIPFKVKVTQCTPLTLVPEYKPKSIVLDMKKGEDQKLTTLLPVYDQKPYCGFKIDYTVTGTNSWITYDLKPHAISVARTSAINGKYDIKIQASIEFNNINL